VVVEGGSGKKSIYVLWIDSKWGGMDGVGLGQSLVKIIFSISFILLSLYIKGNTGSSQIKTLD